MFEYYQFRAWEQVRLICALILPRAKTMANVFQPIRWMFLDYIDYYYCYYIDYIECFLMPNFFSTWEIVQGPVCDCAGLAFEGVFCDQGELDDESWMTKTKCWENIGQHQSHRVHCDQVIDLNLTSCSSSWLFLLSRTVAIRVRK